MNFQINSALDSEKAFLVNVSDMVGRLDPSFYRPYFRRRREQLAASSFPVVTLGSLKGRIFQGVGRNLVENAPNRLLKVKNITTDGFIDFTDTEPVADVPKSKLLQPGDIISPFIGAAIKGYKFAKFSGADQPCAVDNNTGVIRLTDSRITSDYLHAFCQTGLIRWQLDQHTGGGGVPFLGSEYARRMMLPMPPSAVQSAVVKKLREAERRKKAAEAKASKLLESIDDILLDELGIPRKPESPNILEGRIFRRSLSDVSGGRLDPIGNQEKRRLLEEAIHSSHCQIMPLRKLVNASKTIVKEISEGENYVGLENIDGASGEFVATSDKESIGTAVQFTAGKILFPKLRPYLNKIHLATFGGICSTEFHVFDAHGVSAEYLTNFLRSRSIVGITSLLMTGNTLPRLQTSDIARLSIPVPPSDVQGRICKEIDHIRNNARKLREKARADLEKAKRDIEAMIFGKATTE